MKRTPAIFIALLLCTFFSCKKEAEQFHPSNAEASLSNQAANLQTQAIETVYGLDYMVGGVKRIETKLNYAGLKLARNQLMLSIKTKGSFIDKYIEDGYNVQINLNWANTSKGPVAFPADTNKIKKGQKNFLLITILIKNKYP